MDGEYCIKSQVRRTMKVLGYDKDELLMKLIDHSFQPFYKMTAKESGFDNNTLLKLLSQFELRINQMIVENPTLNDPRYRAMVMEVLRGVLVSSFDDKEIEVGLKYHLADKFESIINDLTYIKGISDSKEILKDDLIFMAKKKREFNKTRKGTNLDNFWKLKNKEWNAEKDLLLSRPFLLAFEKVLRHQKLIGECDKLEPVFSKKPIDPENKINWKGTQIALVFMMNIFSDGPDYNDQSLYVFIADRFFIKEKEVTPRKINNTYYNFIDKYFGKNKLATPESFVQIIQILKKALELARV